jgi:hypothetical protein
VKKVDSDTLIEMVDPVIIVQFNGNRVLVPVGNFNYEFDGEDHPVPVLTLYQIWKQVMEMFGLNEDTQAITIDVWEELGLRGTIYRYLGKNYTWCKHGETRGYAG